jgi:hypothetical protein
MQVGFGIPECEHDRDPDTCEKCQLKVVRRKLEEAEWRLKVIGKGEIQGGVDFFAGCGCCHFAQRGLDRINDISLNDVRAEEEQARQAYLLKRVNNGR